MSKYVVLAGWEDAPHLTEEAKKELYASIPPHQRKARAQGIPHLGSGLIYPIPEDVIKVQPFDLPLTWKRSYAFDTGWNWNAALFGMLDPASDVLYIYDVYKRHKAEPAVNAAAIQARGKWMAGVADAADINRLDGRSYIQIYRSLGLDIELPEKALEAGILKVWNRLSTGRLKIFANCVPLFEEYRLYARNEKGLIPDQQDHLLDCLRYLVMSDMKRGKIPPVNSPPEYDWDQSPMSLGWMA